MSGMNRRQFVHAGGATLANAALSLQTAVASDPTQMRWANLAPGFTILLTEYIRNRRLDVKHGLKLAEPISYTSLVSFLGDFVAGNYDLCISSWEIFAARHTTGVPIKLVCTITTADMIKIVAKKGGPKDLAQLKDKVLAAPQSTGTYRMAIAVAREYLGIEVERTATIQNINNPAATVALLRAGSADAALTWEPNVAAGLAADPDLQEIFTVGEIYRSKTGRSLPYFGVAVRDEVLKRDPDAGRRVESLFRETVAEISNDVRGAVAIIGDRTGFPAPVMMRAIETGGLKFVFGSMRDDVARSDVITAAEFFHKNGVLAKVPDRSFFIS